MQPSQPLVFILCPAYHGATLLELLLNNHPEISCLGDTIPTPEFDETCSCGSVVSQCAFWRSLRQGIEERIRRPASLCELERPRIVGNRRLNAILGMGLAWISAQTGIPTSRLFQRSTNAFVELYGAFQRTLTELQGTKAFVDGHKVPDVPLLMRHVIGPAADIRIIHLFRDPRGFALSSRKYHGTSIAASARSWVWRHKLIAYLCETFFPSSTLRLLYEDLCRDPEPVLKKVFEFLGVNQNVNVIFDPRNSPKYHLLGNKMLFSFDGSIALDQKWSSELGLHECETIKTRCAGLSRRLGLSLYYS